MNHHVEHEPTPRLFGYLALALCGVFAAGGCRDVLGLDETRLVDIDGAPGVDAPPPLTADFMLCHADSRKAEELARRHMGLYLASVLEHYEVMGDHFATTEGYDAYAQAARTLQKIGESGFLEGFMKAAAHGTPDRILEQFEERRELLGDFELATCFRYGGIPYEEAEKSLRLFAKEVLPVLQSW